MNDSIIDEKVHTICNIVEMVCIILGYPNTRNIDFVNTYPDRIIRFLLRYGFVILFHIIVRLFISILLKNLYTMLFV